MDHRDDKDLQDLLELQGLQELQDQVVQQGLKGIKAFLVLLVPKVIREKEVMCSPKLQLELLLSKCVNSSSRAIYLGITPS